jgi:hypothetical protein
MPILLDLPGAVVADVAMIPIPKLKGNPVKWVILRMK